MPEDNFIDKTTSVKTVERVKFHTKSFSSGSKIEISIAFNPENSSHIDQFLSTDPQKNTILLALEGFKNMLESQGIKILKD